ALCAEHFPEMRVCVCANLPYYITSPIIMKLLETNGCFESLTVMIQKEVADRICAEAGSSDYGAITAAVAYRANAEKCFNVSPGNFIPPPKVTSTVVKMNMLKTPAASCKDPEKMFAIIKLAFGQRRKTLSNALSSEYEKAAVENALETLGFPRDVRGEKLSVFDFAALCDII
ncbi:MAG: 16S rRNA (adenine(1518)-N(6)/adenine(1519)-N(6))-dimethyltransferase, partial [Clostridiales bacterium]|nr:16S rRNA (adenine(1518)-N(6)/adenine(1519)-N(6))-dimethyltransferase [Clostridiales bacterium]